MVAVLMGQEHGIDILESERARRERSPEPADTYATVNEKMRSFAVNQQSVSTTAASQTCDFEQPDSFVGTVRHRRCFDYAQGTLTAARQSPSHTFDEMKRELAVARRRSGKSTKGRLRNESGRTNL